MANEDSGGGFFVGFLFGAFVGATLALLFAPAPGEDLRKQLREKGIELKEHAGDLSIEASKTAEELKARFEEAIEDGKQAAARKKEELLAQLEAAKSGDASIEVTEQDA